MDWLTEKRQTNQINELICQDLQSNKSIIKQQENEMTKMTENQGNLRKFGSLMILKN